MAAIAGRKCLGAHDGKCAADDGSSDSDAGQQMPPCNSQPDAASHGVGQAVADNEDEDGGEVRDHEFGLVVSLVVGWAGGMEPPGWR